MSPATRSELAEAESAVRVRFEHNVPRWLFAALAAVVAAVSIDPVIGGVWLAIYGLTQAAEFVVLRPVAKGAEMTPRRLAAAVLILAVAGFAFGSLAVVYWSALGSNGGPVAVLIIIGALLNALTISMASRRLFLASTAPAFFYLALLPMLALLKTQSYAALLPMFAGSAAVMTAVLMLWRHVERTRRAEQQSRRELESAVARAEAAVAAKSSFVAMVGHELRTPISGVLAAAGELERASDPEVVEHGRMIADSGRLMRLVLNDLLDMAKIEAGRMAVEDTVYDLRDLVEQTCRFWSVEAGDKGLDLGLRGVDALPRHVHGDPTRLRQVLNNLLSNAVKFTAKGGVSVVAQLGEDAQGAVFRLAVADTGLGMSAQVLEQLFTPFQQAEASTTRRYGGTGLGLSISRHLTQLMDGELSVDSVPGAGSTFTLKLPLRIADRPCEEAPPAETAVPLPMGAVTGVRVLVADDHSINRRAVRLLLSPLEPDLVEAEDGEGALAALAAQPFDVVLMDVRMPDMSGLDVVRRLRASDGPNRETPVVAVTASTEAEDIVTCLSAGMNSFVAKPLEARELLLAVSRSVTTPAYRLNAGEEEELRPREAA